MCYNRINKEREDNKMYILKNFDNCDRTWNYLNCFTSYSEACEEMERLKKVLGWTLDIFYEKKA